MGRYINKVNGKKLPDKGKVDFLLNEIIDVYKFQEPPKEFEDNLVCVVENKFFDGAAWCYSENEMRAFMPTDEDKRPRTWLIVPNAKSFVD